ncbi:Abhydrolase-3 domain-containing protein [Fusarium sp. Ph1]|nr:Abhydrolase-3 domain-containing protein [Fusarium sp. Ph1]
MSQFRHVTESNLTGPQDLLKGCPTLLEEQGTSENIVSDRFSGIYAAKFPRSTHIIMYVHGGGFVSGSPEGVAGWLLQLIVELRARGILVDVFCVRYSLAPEHPFPDGLRQVVAAYEELVSREGKPIILAGESAGSNLCLDLLRHLVDPHPEIPPVKGGNRGGKIVAACLTCPWVDLRNESESMHRNAKYDCLEKKVLDKWREAYLGGLRPNDNWTSPVDFPGDWRDILPPHVLLVAGGLELFLSDILRLADKIRKGGHKGLDLCVVPLKGHAWHLMDFRGIVPGKEAAKADTDNAGGYMGVTLHADWIAEKLLLASM